MSNQILLPRHVIVLLAVAVALSAAVGFLTAQVLSPGTAEAGNAQAAAGGSKKVVKELKAINAGVQDLDESIGTTISPLTVRGLLDDIEANTCETVRELGGSCF